MKRKTLYLLSILCILCQAIKGHDRDTLPGGNIRPASVDEVVDKAKKTAPEYHDLIKEYHTHLYTKGYIHIKKKNFLIHYIPSMFKVKKGKKEYMIESFSELHYTAPDIFDRKIKANHSTIDKLRKFNNEIFDYFDISVYSSSLFDTKLISPLSHKAFRYYKYRLDSIHPDESGNDLYHISFIPKYNSYQLIEGYMDIYDETWKVNELRFKGGSEYINYTSNIYMGDNKFYSDELLPEKIDMEMTFHLLGNVIDSYFTICLDSTSVKLTDKNEVIADPKSKCDLTKSYTLRNDTSAFLMADSSYFNKRRPIPLTEKEKSIYEQYYAGKEKENADVELNTKTKSKLFWGDVGDLLVGNYSINSPHIGRIRFSPLINPFLLSYSGKDGFSYRQNIRCQRLFNKNRLLSTEAMIGYNFHYNEFYWRVPLKFEYMPSKRASLGLTIGNGNRIYNSEILDEIKEIPDSIFNFNNIHLEYFHDFYTDIVHRIEVTNGLTIDAGIAMHHRKAIKKSDFSKPENLPVELRNEYDDKFRNKYASFAPRVKISWTPRQYYYKVDNRKINLHSEWPTYSFSYERGIKGVFNNSSEFESMEFDIQHTVSFGLLRTLYYRAGAGIFTNKEETFFVDFRNFTKNNLPMGWNDDIGGTFQILDRRWYNASKEYVRANLTYETPFLLTSYLFKRLPNILNERIYLGILIMPHLNPYIELGYGIGTHVFDFGVFCSNKNGKFHDVGVKLTIELFNR